MQFLSQKVSLKLLQIDFLELVKNLITVNNEKKNFKLLIKINLERYIRCLQKYIISSKNIFVSYLSFNIIFTSFHSVKYLCIF